MSNSGKSFKSIADILNIDGQDGSFDDDEALKARERQEERDAYAKQLRERIADLKSKGNEDEYKKEMLKLLGSEGMEVLMAMKNEVEDNPTARSAEVFATVMSSIAGTITELERIDNNAAKIDVDHKKIQANATNPAIIHGSNNNVVMVGSTNDLLTMLEEGGVINSNTSHKTVEAEATVVEDTQETEDVKEEKVIEDATEIRENTEETGD
jgi:hypothetical protein